MDTSHGNSHPPMERRSFLKWATHGLGALFGALLGIPAVAYLIDARNRAARIAGFRTIAKLSDLKVGEPTQAVIRDVRQDAWTLHPNDVVGRVWLIKRDDKHVDAYTTVCPHLGCSVNFKAQEQRFVCPCHNGTFDINGQRVELTGASNPAPRGMDLLDIEIKDDLIAVKYQNFRQGEHEKIPKA